MHEFGLRVWTMCGQGLLRMQWISEGWNAKQAQNYHCFVSVLQVSKQIKHHLSLRHTVRLCQLYLSHNAAWDAVLMLVWCKELLTTVRTDPRGRPCIQWWTNEHICIFAGTGCIVHWAQCHNRLVNKYVCSRRLAALFIQYNLQINYHQGKPKSMHLQGGWLLCQLCHQQVLVFKGTGYFISPCNLNFKLSKTIKGGNACSRGAGCIAQWTQCESQITESLETLHVQGDWLHCSAGTMWQLTWQNNMYVQEGQSDLFKVTNSKTKYKWICMFRGICHTVQQTQSQNHKL